MLKFGIVCVASAVFAVSVNLVDNSNCSSSYLKYRCKDGGCVNATSVCDGTSDCADGSDETSCDVTDISPLDDEHLEGFTSLNRSKRQLQCDKNQWRCQDGSCINFDGKCDGRTDCPDGSDETFPLCRKNQCYSHWFRCTYGACVDGTAPCNNIQDCADNSDELLPSCRNETEVRGSFVCSDGTKIQAFYHCDGTKHCPDGSDETLSTCSGKYCADYLFQCAYGACVDGGSDCNGKQECADGSDESNELCKPPDSVISRVKPSVPGGSCILPPYPEHGTYKVFGHPNAKPGQAFEYVTYTVSCNEEYKVLGPNSKVCSNGKWGEGVIRCVKFCKLNKDPSVEFLCILQDGLTGHRRCGELEPSGTVVKPVCNAPNYYYPSVLEFMRCVDGQWNRVARCLPECGLVSPNATGLIGGPEAKQAKRGELPWHTGIYLKTKTPYQQICGGSLVSSKLVISAAHCFWHDTTKAQPASNYAVALGKIYKFWKHPEEDEGNIQRSDVSALYMPERFQGATANFQDDIALVWLETEVKFSPFIRPVCLNFDVNLDKKHLMPGQVGKVAGWGYISEDGERAKTLRTIRVPYVSVTECLVEARPDFRPYITGDKICAGYRNGSALCQGDSGGGLAFPETDVRGLERYYLRGIVSTAPNEDKVCNLNWLTLFTQVSRHEDFIRPYLSNT